MVIWKRKGCVYVDQHVFLIEHHRDSPGSANICRIQNVGNGTENEVCITEGLHMGKKQELLGRCQNQKNNKQLYVYQLSETGIEIQGGKAGR